MVIEALPGQFSKCESAHEISLSLSDLQPNVNLLLSCCLCPNQWQETQCFREYVTTQSDIWQRHHSCFLLTNLPAVI
jgi:hypothetical protein